jgi:hypothetical protein
MGHAPDRSVGVTRLEWQAQVVRAIGGELQGFEVDGLHLE